MKKKTESDLSWKRILSKVEWKFSAHESRNETRSHFAVGSTHKVKKEKSKTISMKPHSFFVTSD